MKLKSFRLNNLSINTITLNFILSICFLILYNISFANMLFKIFENLSGFNFSFLISLPIFFICVFYIFFSLISIKYIEKPLLILIIICSSITSYYSYFYSVIFDIEMFVNIFETHQGEAYSYINFSVVIWVLLTGILPALLLYKIKINHFNFAKEFFYKAISCFIAVILLFISFFLFSKDFMSIKKNNPTVHHHIVPIFFVKSFFGFIKNNYLEPRQNYKILGTDAKINSNNLKKKNLLVIAVGETARKQNHQYTGYNRETTPFTIKKDIIAFQQVSSCGTATATSVPCMFSRIGRKAFRRNKAKSEDNLMDIINRTNTNVLWIDNDAGCKGVCSKIVHIDIPANKDNKFCDGSSCHDEILVEYLENELNKLDAKDSIVVLHLIGSHGPTYYERYPNKFKKFIPDCPRSDIQNCTNEQLINTYDNTILYTDYVISKVIDTLESKQNKWNTSLIYLSDHGESLGENNLYFHGSPYFIAPDEQTKVPMIMWFSKDFINNNNINENNLKKAALSNFYSHDNLFDTVLGLMNISTEIYNKDLDIINSAKNN